MVTRTLPSHPDLEQLKIQAKDLLKSYRAHEPEVVLRVQTQLPHLSNPASPGDGAQ